MKKNIEPILSVLNLELSLLSTDGRRGTVLRDFSLEVFPGEILCLIGESGCGKSISALAIMGLLDKSTARIEKGFITFEKESLLEASPARLEELRGSKMAMVFQEPMTCLNPLLTIGEQVGEVYLAHTSLSWREIKKRAVEDLKRVGIPEPEARINDYPHRLSGGMRQRVMIAMAMALEPSLLIADEPTTALDVTVQAGILELLKNLVSSKKRGTLLITHDFGVVAEVAHRVAVMYAGSIVEFSPVVELFDRPLHPYTQALLACLPGRNSEISRSNFFSIEGEVPSPFSPLEGCPFHPRCPQVFELCRKEFPLMYRMEEGRGVRCHLYPQSN